MAEQKNTNILEILINSLCKVLKNQNLLDENDIRVKYHSIQELNDRIRVLMRLFNAICPSLSFVALKNNEKQSTESFTTGILTPQGPVSINCDLHLWDGYRFLKPDEKVYFNTNLSNTEKCEYLQSLTKCIIESQNIDVITNAMNESLNLKESEKPYSFHKGILTPPPEVSPSQKRPAKKEIAEAISTIIKHCNEANLINYKHLQIVDNTPEQLFNITLELVCLISALCPELSFASEKHYDKDDKMFEDDFIVGFYTSFGQVSFHFKNQYRDRFSHLQWIERAPKYDGYDHAGLLYRIESLTNCFTSGKSVNDIIEEIRKNTALHPSQKPPILSGTQK